MHLNQSLNGLEHVFCIQDKNVQKKQNAMHVCKHSDFSSSFSFFGGVCLQKTML